MTHIAHPRLMVIAHRDVTESSTLSSELRRSVNITIPPPDLYSGK
jgi:hypothetical protein